MKGYVKSDGFIMYHAHLSSQVLALQWVKDNIRDFGGDGDDVTVFGESAGALSISWLSLSPYSNGLFSKVILMSGAAGAPFDYLPESRSLEEFYSLG